MFDIFLTDRAKKQLKSLRTDKGLQKRYKSVAKCIVLLSENPRHSGLQTHEFTSLKGLEGQKVFVAYAEQSTPAAYRVFWYYGPEQKQITIITVTPHPKLF